MRHSPSAIRRSVWLALVLSGAGLAVPAEGGREPPERPLSPPRRGEPVSEDRAMPGLDSVIGLGATLALAALGVGMIATRRRRSRDGEAGLRVVGRAHLTGRHAVVLLRVGGRTLILGVGSQGPPTLLGELDGPPGGDRSDSPGVGTGGRE